MVVHCCRGLVEINFEFCSWCMYCIGVRGFAVGFCYGFDFVGVLVVLCC